MKTNLLLLVGSLLLAVLMGGCAQRSPATPITKGEAFAPLYEEQPRSILILPPMNESTDAEAKEFYTTTTEVPFALMGYYVFPVEMVSDILKQEGIYDAAALTGMPADKFYEYFGADSILFTTIHKWDTSYAVVSSSLKVSISAKLVSTKTNRTLWSNTQTIVVNLGCGSASSLEELLINTVLTAISTATADYVTYAKEVNQRLIYTLPAGPYSPHYMQDQDVVIGQSKH